MRDKTSSIKISTLVYGRQGDLYSAVSIAGLHLCYCHHRTITQALACRSARTLAEKIGALAGMDEAMQRNAVLSRLIGESSNW